jgi:ABC-type phosphate/phosphonate transport system substrate-binding protein
MDNRLPAAEIHTVRKLKLLVAPSDTANNSERWFEFVVYLSRRLDCLVGLDTALDSADFIRRMPQADLVIAGPQEAVLLWKQARFIPICRPQNQAEEVVFVTHRANAVTTLASFQDQTVLSVSNSVQSRLGLTLLGKKGVRPASVQNCDSWMAVLKAVQSDSGACAFLSKTFLDALTPLSRESLRVIASSTLNRAHAQLLIHPDHGDLQDLITMTLLSMHECEKGVQVLEKLGVSQWAESNGQSLGQLATLLRI